MCAPFPTASAVVVHDTAVALFGFAKSRAFASSSLGRLALVAISLTTLATTAACDSCKSGGGTATDATADAAVAKVVGLASLTPEEAQKVLAKVGNKTITLGDYVAVLERMDQFDRLRYQSPERRKELLDELINIELLAQEATDKGYDKDPQAQEELRIVLRDAFLAEAHKDAAKPTDIPESEVRAYYEAHLADYNDPERRRVSALVTRDEASAQSAITAAKAAKSAAEWGQLVKERSVDPTAKADVPVDLLGDLGITSPPDDPRGDNPRVPQAVRVALFQMKNVGDISDKPIRVQDRVYVIRFTGKTEPRKRAFEEAERVIRVKLSQEKLRAREKALLADLRKQFPVEVDQKVLANVHVASADAGAHPAEKPDGAAH